MSAVSRRSLNSTAAAIASCGQAVEASLQRTDVAITMGGEPTFVPLRPEGAEWGTAALGPTKLDYARRLAHRLIARTYPGAVLLETSGKHFPGEPLPRWTLLLQRRADGKPIWENPARMRSSLEPGSHKLSQARAVIKHLAGSLNLPPACIRPLALGKKPAGYVLPIDHEDETWRSDDWSLDFDGPIPLFEGDSCAGLRLPLGELGKERLRRALTVEIREGCVAIFIPPLLTDAYLELLTKIEAALAARELTEVILAGYAPPSDPAMPTIGFASDPGVLEINLAPCATWADYDRQLHDLYAAAKATGLTARKLQFNGRETGTGGGAHVVFGGPDGLYSPFFAFPHLLPSVIRYFQHHPALSFAFTGLYMGPSSQAPRIDESTYEALYELEIACAGAESMGYPPNLPQFDLLFRDLLMDRSGNTHRAEISVDKLHNPFAPNGRLGLVEFRSFESHPDASTMSLIGLLLRAIMARLVGDPFKTPFVRWSGQLHDRFLLPSFIWEDLQAVVADLNAHAIPFDVEWLRAFWKWRFPKIGSFDLSYQDEDGKPQAASVTFRQALEAWPLLGESPNAGTVSRTVDSSMDRIEVAVSDPALIEKGLLLANGYPCEFLSAGDTTAAGIRFRAFHLYPSLHPHVPVHAPLILEWVDRATFTVIAAARWHVWDADDKSYKKRPTSEKAAAKRFASRWEDWPHTVGETRWIREIDFPPEGKHTLDLRRYPAQSRG
ncbi:transglutaminase family protein [Synoicihabitans lomoniglobus]|uniref:Transglutaminase family protein n=1 Tax=Synoicihabitans lomoniglobus TaxID=2909285 RepID=A0AAF0CT44_9BACT|nr:transglutaminase family protein [Opitutaceae bacterium LMO-M01]WED67431.1 transglutaminase family protein [Opitutaceae bacterium LMO-M01]